MTYPIVVTRPVPVSLQSSRLLGRRALITSTDSALGASVASAFSQEGAAVVSIGGAPTDDASAASMIDAAALELGGLDLVVVIPEPSKTESAATPIDQVLQRNIYPLFWLSKAAQRHFAPGSAIITTDIVDGIGRQSSITEAKAGIETVTLSLAQRFESDGVRVNGVAPHEHRTDTAHVAAAYLDAATGTMTGQMLVV